MKNYIKEYFTNPDNVHAGIYTFDYGSLKPKDFFLAVEPIQEKASIFFKHIVCKDGFKMSVQASYGHYCTPRVTLYRTSLLYYGGMIP